MSDKIPLGGGTSIDPGLQIDRIARVIVDVAEANLPVGSRVVLVIEADVQHPGLSHASSELTVAISDLGPATASRILTRALSRVEAEGRSS